MMYAHVTVLPISGRARGHDPHLGGCSTHNTVTLVVSKARKATMPKAAKLQWVQCPCGAGPQDSAHLLHCVHKAVAEVRERAIELADICIRDNAPARGQSADAFARSRTSWAALNEAQRALASLGSTGTGMNWHTRSAVVAVAADSWRQLERAWTVVNTEA